MKSTKPRREILRLLKNGGAFTAKELHQKLSHIDQATIYRNLKAFTKTGELREIHISREGVRYEYMRDNHQHALCRDCNELRHFDIDKEAVIKALDLQDFEIENIEINVTGVCK